MCSGMPPEGQRDVGRLLIVCPDRPGIVAAVSEFLFEHGANIVHSDQHSTSPFGGTFFMRVEFSLAGIQALHADLEAGFRGQVAERFGMRWWLSLAARRKRLGVFVSRAEHALLELLWQQRAGDLPAEIVVVISNHANNADLVTAAAIPFFHVPVTAELKPSAEAEQLRIL